MRDYKLAQKLLEEAEIRTNELSMREHGSTIEFAETLIRDQVEEFKLELEEENDIDYLKTMLFREYQAKEKLLSDMRNDVVYRKIVRLIASARNDMKKKIKIESQNSDKTLVRLENEVIKLATILDLDSDFKISDISRLLNEAEKIQKQRRRGKKKLYRGGVLGVFGEDVSNVINTKALDKTILTCQGLLGSYLDSSLKIKEYSSSEEFGFLGILNSASQEVKRFYKTLISAHCRRLHAVYLRLVELEAQGNLIDRARRRIEKFELKTNKKFAQKFHEALKEGNLSDFIKGGNNGK